MEEEKYIGLYIGPNKIKKVEKSKRTTYQGKKVYKIEYENGKVEERPKEMVDQLVTIEESDLTKLRDRIGAIVAKKFLEILLEAEVRLENIEYILSLTAQSINQNLDQAESYLWGKELYDRQMNDVQDVLKKKIEEEEKSKKNNKP